MNDEVRKRRAVFLDRDGVLNRTQVINGKPFAPKKLKDFYIIPNSAEALVRLKNLNYLLIVVSNQPDVGNGEVDKSTVVQMNKILVKELPIDKIKVCFHSQREDCECRKPKPGMLFDAASELNIDLKKSFMIGDRWSDISAGASASCSTILIDYHYNETLIDQPNFRATSLGEAVDEICKQHMEN